MNVAPNYASFLDQKTQLATADGFKADRMPKGLFDFQEALIEWAVWKGRAAIFADCGLGKSVMQLTWADNVARKTNQPVLILTPLAVSAQTKREADKFGIEARLALDGKIRPGINIANYDRLHYFDGADDIAGMVCDESAILKSFDGARRQQITDRMRKMRYRLLCTATPSPNEYIELGTSSEALGHLGYMDMLSRFFKNQQGNSIKPHVRRPRHSERDRILEETAKWRLKGHAETPFWQWVCSWSRAVRKPSDLGFEDGAFILPPLTEREHLVDTVTLPAGEMFARPAVGLKEQREERRRTIEERCARSAGLVNGTGQPALVWCQLNDEGDTLERMISDCVQVSGKDSEDAKEEKFLAFIDGKARVLVTKEKIGAWGLNFQHCNHSVSFPSHSFEGYYQSVRRCWRFGQKRPVTVDIVTTDGDSNVLANLQRKAVAADKMFAELVRHMNNAINIDRTIAFNKQEGLPSWL